MEKQYVDRAQEWVKWYMYHRNDTMSVEARVEFQRKCIQGLFEMLARTIDEMARIEEGHNRPQIILPTGLMLNDPIRADHASHS